MALTNMQYDSVIRYFQDLQNQDRKTQEQHIREAQLRIPRLAEIQDEVAALSVRKARILLRQDSTIPDFDLNAALADLKEERTTLLLINGYPEDYLELPSHCRKCRDTGFVNGKKCSCFIQKEVDFLYNQSNLRQILLQENFDTFVPEYYSEFYKDPKTGYSARETAQRAYIRAKEFVAGFHDRFENLCIYGDTGVGKTFLSHCIARELIEQGCSVLYMTAFELFESLEARKFNTASDITETHSHIFDCDLLIIDDLGSELNNSFTTSQLFLCMNQRILDRKSTIISTNLSMEELRSSYSERIFSRLLSNYKMIPLFGKDIRIQQQLGGH